MLPQNYQYFFEKIMHASLLKELKNGFEMLVGQMVFKLWIKTVKTMLYLRTTWPT